MASADVIKFLVQSVVLTARLDQPGVPWSMSFLSYRHHRPQGNVDLLVFVWHLDSKLKASYEHR